MAGLVPALRETLRILLVSTQESTRDQVGAALAGCVGDCRLYWVSQPDLANVRIHDLAPHVVLVDDELGGADPVELVHRLATGLPEIAVLSLVRPDAMTVARKAVLAGARGFVTKPVEPDEILAALRQVLAKPAARLEAGMGLAAGQVVVFCAPKGGTGRTTLALNTAISLRQLTGESVVLVDADYAAPAIDVALNLPADHNITDLLPKVSQLDPELVAGVLATHKSGVQVLLAPPPEHLTAPISLPQVQRVTVWLKRMFSWVIVDLGLPLDETAYAFLDMADRVVMSVLPEMVGLRNARLMLDQLHARHYPTGKVWPVLNREGMPAGIPLADLEARLGEKTTYRIPNDQEMATETINRGVPMVIAHRRSATARAYKGLAQELVKATSTTSQETASAGLPAALAATGLASVATESSTAVRQRAAQPRGVGGRRGEFDADRAGRMALAIALGVLLVAFAAGLVLLRSGRQSATQELPVAFVTELPEAAAAATPEIGAIAEGGNAGRGESIQTAPSAPGTVAPLPTGLSEGSLTPAQTTEADNNIVFEGGSITTPAPPGETQPESPAVVETAASISAGGETPTGDQVVPAVSEMSTSISATALAASTPGPTQIPTDTPEPTSTSTVTLTRPQPPSPSPTPPATATPTPSLTPTRRSRPTATRAPSATQIATAAIVSVPGLVAPAPNESRSGEVTFTWQPTGPLPANAAYEVVWWNAGEDPAAARGIAPPTTETSLTANLDVLYQSGQLTSSSVYWTVLVVSPAPYKRLTQPGASSPRVFVLAAPSEGEGGAAPPKPK